MRITNRNSECEDPRSPDGEHLWVQPFSDNSGMACDYCGEILTSRWVDVEPGQIVGTEDEVMDRELEQGS